MIILDRDLKPTAKHDHAISYWWRMKFSTYDIAKKLGVHESVVANRLLHVRSTYRGDRPDVVGRVVGDPPAGRSSLDQRVRGE